MRRRYPNSAALFACTVLLSGGAVFAAPEDERPEPGESPEIEVERETQAVPQEPAPDADGQTLGYSVQESQVGGPADVNRDLDTSFPKEGSVLDGLRYWKWFEFKKELYEVTRLKLAINYQMIYQHASETMDIVPGRDFDSAVGHWAQIEGKWELLNPGEDFMGSIVAAGDWRDTIGGGTANPAKFGTLDVGSMDATAFGFFEWDPSLTLLYWEQWLKKDVFEVRVGKQLAIQTFDFFRFKDSRTSFTGDTFSTTAAVMPAPGFGQAVSFKWWPARETTYDELYIHGTVNDMNGTAEDFGETTVFDEADYFYGLEIGYFWKRKFPADFDHVHLNVYYADEHSKFQDGDIEIVPNESGWGFKLAGSKQWGPLVGFGNYTYNTAEGGGFGITLARHNVNVGAAWLRPFDVRGEIGLGFAWLDSFKHRLDDQYNVETYWKILLTPDLWITPGVQFIFEPALQPDEDFVTVAGIRLRLFF